MSLCPLHTTRLLSPQPDVSCLYKPDIFFPPFYSKVTYFCFWRQRWYKPNQTNPPNSSQQMHFQFGANYQIHKPTDLPSVNSPQMSIFNNFNCQSASFQSKIRQQQLTPDMRYPAQPRPPPLPPPLRSHIWVTICTPNIPQRKKTCFQANFQPARTRHLQPKDYNLIQFMWSEGWL